MTYVSYSIIAIDTEGVLRESNELPEDKARRAFETLKADPKFPMVQLFGWLDTGEPHLIDQDPPDAEEPKNKRKR